ncbi:MAG: M1 family metallopeptidase [Saprospiraceae bacterium]
MKNLLFWVLLQCCWLAPLSAQVDFYHHHKFDQADTLRGMLLPERACYDVKFYALDLCVDVEQKTIVGEVQIDYEVVEPFTRMQIDLFQNLKIHDILQQGKSLSYERIANAVLITLPLQKEKGSITVRYGGQPIIAKNAPWDGGFVWKNSSNGKAWVGVACEGTGASLWWPNKDHLSDEPDSLSIKVTVPKDLTCISNGILRNSIPVGTTQQQFHWFVSYPINNYNVTLNIGDYKHFQDQYTADDGEKLDLDYYVLSENLAKAKKHFQQVPKVLACFERYFGKYPFWEDGYALVETPYLGMEHQGAIAYGNRYMRGYLGGMIPRDMNWDYIIVHETGHEYWGNSISCNDHAEMWIHESFTTYMEALYVECAYDYEQSIRYLKSQLSFIANKQPIVGPLNVNWAEWNGSDHYFKGSWVLHTLRHAINDDLTWFEILKSFYDQHAYGHVVTEDFVAYVNKCTKKDFRAFFQQYLYYPTIPSFQYELSEKAGNLTLRYRWDTPVTNFDMPLKVGTVDKYQMIHPTTNWQTTTLKKVNAKNFKVATELFLINTTEVL